MLKSKFGQIPLLKTIIILLSSSLILIVYIIALNQMQTIHVEDKKIRTQIIESKLINECFSNELGTIESDKFTESNLNSCFNENTNNIYVKIILEDKTDKILYIGNKEDFENKMQFCQNQKSNILCTKLKYPIIYKENENELKQKILTTLVIVS